MVDYTDPSSWASAIGLGNIKGGMMDIAVYIIWGIVLLAIGLVIYMKYQDNKIYKNPVRLLRQRQNGMTKESNYYGGYITKNGITHFEVKVGRFKKKKIDRLPLSEFMDEDDRVYYYQISPDAPWIQVKKEFQVEQVLVKNENYIEPTEEEKENIIKNFIEEAKLDEDYKNKTDEELNILARNYLQDKMEAERNVLVDITKVKYTPFPSDQKQSAMLDIANLRNTLGVDVNKQFLYFVAGVIGLVVLGIIVFYIAVNKGDVPILTK